MRFIFCLLGLLFLAACAKSPNAIAPAYVSTANYQGWTCSQLNREAANLESALRTASAQQDQARGNDVAGVLLIGLPVSTLSGDNVAPQIADIKGKQEAVRQVRVQKNC